MANRLGRIRLVRQLPGIKPAVSRVGGSDMTEADKQEADTLLGKIETAAGQLPDRDGTNAPLIARILSSVNGLRTICGVVRPH